MGGTPWQRVSSAVIGGFASLGLPIFEESQVGRHAPDGLHIFNTRSTREDRNWVEYELKRSPGGLRTRKTIENMAPDCLEVALVSVGAHRGGRALQTPNFTKLYLEHQVADGLHILGACSTHGYSKLAEYEPQRTGESRVTLRKPKFHRNSKNPDLPSILLRVSK